MTIRFRRPAAVPAPAKVAHVVQAEGWLKNNYHQAGDVVHLSPREARYLVQHGRILTKADHDAKTAADAARASAATDVAPEPETPASEPDEAVEAAS